MRFQFLWEFIRDNCYSMLLVWLLLFVFCKRAAAGKGEGFRMSRQMYRCFIGLSFVIYVLILLYVTIFSREPFAERHIMLSFLWEYRLALAGSMSWVLQILNNIILFVPMGVLYGELSRKRTWWRALLLGAGTSAFIEGMQFVLKAGLCETDDVFNNTIGMMLGYIFWLFCGKILRYYGFKP